MLNLLILFTLGGTIGWTYSMVQRARGSQRHLSDILIGISGAYLAGLALNEGAINQELSALSLFGACCGAILLLALADMVRKRGSSE